MPWYFFAALTPVLYSVSNFMDKFLVDKRIKEPLVITSTFSITSGILGLIFLAFIGFPWPGLFQILLIIGSGLLLTFYLLPYYQAMRLDDASRVVPLFQFIPVFTLIMSTVFLKETLAGKQIIGLILVVVAGVLISAEKIEAGIFKPRKSLWLMLLSGFMYGTIGIIFRFVARDIGFWTILGYQYLGTGLGGLVLLTLPKVRNAIKVEWVQIKSSLGIITTNNLIGTVAQMSEVYAVTLVAVPLVNIISGIQPVLVLIFGFVLSVWFPHIIKEDIRKVVVVHKILSIAIILVGLYLVYF